MDVWSVVTVMVIIVVTISIFYARRASRYFELFNKNGIPNHKPWPILGNSYEMFSQGFMSFFDGLYKEYENEKVFGVHEPGKALFVIKNLDMVRDVCIKNFNYFVNRRIILEREPFDTVMPNLKDEQWRRVRHGMSPAFSTGKLKQMFFHVEQSASFLVSNLKQSCEEDKLIELKDVCSCFSMDVIASAGFGVKLDSLNDKKNQFLIEAQKLISGLTNSLVVVEMIFPAIISILEKIGIELLPLESARFFQKFVHEAVANRKEMKSSVKRPDFIQLMVDTEELPPLDSSKELTNDQHEGKGMTLSEFQGQALIFFLAGYDTVSTTMAFTLFILAHHPECVQKLQEEQDRVLGGNPPTYESVQSMTYLEMCVNEAMRMYPAALFIDRQCNEDCNIGGIDIPKDAYVVVPIFSIHNDPKLWPQPETFDPERFTSENREGRHPFAFLPFGQGPRNCIGMRLALLEVKVGIASILQEMTPIPCEKSVYPMKLEKYDLKAVDGLWVKFVNRDK